MNPGQRYLALAIVAVVSLIILLFSIRVSPARDLGQWEAQDPAVTEWYRGLMRPDAPESSCCGEADAYWCDDVHVSKDRKTFCKITDDRPDEPRGRPHVDVGTEFEIPNEKLKWDRSNPTGHFIIFLSRGGFVYCFVQGSGI